MTSSGAGDLHWATSTCSARLAKWNRSPSPAISSDFPLPYLLHSLCSPLTAQGGRPPHPQRPITSLPRSSQAIEAPTRNGVRCPCLESGFSCHTSHANVPGRAPKRKACVALSSILPTPTEPSPPPLILICPAGQERAFLAL